MEDADDDHAAPRGAAVGAPKHQKKKDYMHLNDDASWFKFKKQTEKQLKSNGYGDILTKEDACLSLHHHENVMELLRQIVIAETF